ncbi:MAG: hypothetical protein F6K31_04735 [Symploca sp. SIO2G7]|nr:hypothetical protein [Symploca sp. SIO2G7]
MEITKEKRKIVVLLPQLPQLPSSLSSLSSLDNDTFTLTCHQWVLGERIYFITRYNVLLVS